ncbi:hypothetical protein D3C81_2329690 [compost metagenome]
MVEADAYTPDTTDLIERPVITAIRPDTINDLLWSRVKDVEKPVLDCIQRILAEAA